MINNFNSINRKPRFAFALAKKYNRLSNGAGCLLYDRVKYLHEDLKNQPLIFKEIHLNAAAKLDLISESEGFLIFYSAMFMYEEDKYHPVFRPLPLNGRRSFMLDPDYFNQK